MEGLQGTGFVPWRLTLFGPFRAEHNGRSAEFRTRKTAGLLAYLAYYSGRSVSKEVLVETFWPDADAESGRHSLRMAVSSLRSALAEPGWDSAALTGQACAVGHTRYEDSQELFDRATSIREEMGSPEAIGHTHFYRSFTDYRHGWFDAGLTHLRRSFRAFVDHGVALGQTPLTIGGNLMSVMGRFDAAAACWGKAESARRRYGMKMLPNLRPAYDAEVAKCAKSIGEEALESAMALGSKLTDAALLDLLFGATPAVRAPSSF